MRLTVKITKVISSPSEDISFVIFIVSNEDYPADLLRSLLSSISAWIHHYEKRFRHTAC